MPPESSRYVSPEEMAREAMKLTEVLAKVLSENKEPKPKSHIKGKGGGRS